MEGNIAGMHYGVVEVEGGDEVEGLRFPNELMDLCCRVPLEHLWDGHLLLHIYQGDLIFGPNVAFD